MIATPKIDVNPTAAEMLKFVPVRNSRPQAAQRELKNVEQGEHDCRIQERPNARYSSMKIIASDSGMMNISRRSPSSIC